MEWHQQYTKQKLLGKRKNLYAQRKVELKVVELEYLLQNEKPEPARQRKKRTDENDDVRRKINANNVTRKSHF